MNIDIFTYCDFAAFYSGRLCITGATDVLWAAQMPLKMSLGYIVVKGRFILADEGTHTIKTSLIDQDGKLIISPPSTQAVVQFDKTKKNEIKTHYHIDQISNFSLPKYGEYSLELLFDGNEIASIPFCVLPAPRQK
jgi:hypothetical protein